MKGGPHLDPRIAARLGRELAAKRAALSDTVEERFREEHAARRLRRLLRHLTPYNPVIAICVVAGVVSMRMFNFGVYTSLTYIGSIIAFSILLHLVFSVFLLAIRKSIVAGWISHLLFVSAHGFFVDADPYGGANHAQNGFTALFDRVLGTGTNIDWQRSQDIAFYSAIALAITYCFILVQARSRPPAKS